MQKYIQVSAVLCMPLLLASCLLQSKMEKRYKSATTRTYTPAKDSIKYFVGVSGYAYTAASKGKKQNEEPAKTIFSLSGEGQKQLIESIADNEESTEEIYTKLAQDIVPAKRNYPIATGVGKKFTRKIVLAVDDMHMTQADKIQKLTITLSPKQAAQVRVISCNKLTNNYHRPNGKENETMQSVSMSSVVSADGGITINVDNTGGNTLTGNIAADVIFEYTGHMNNEMMFTFSGLWGRDGSAIKPNGIVAQHHMQQSAGATTPVSFDMAYEAIVRHVVKGDNTISEGDDVVEILKGKMQAGDIEIVKNGQLKPTHWTISDGTRHIELAGSFYNGALEFDSYEEAQDFIVWFKRSSADILANNRISNGDYKIIVSGDSNVLTDSFIENCKVTKS